MLSGGVPEKPLPGHLVSSWVEVVFSVFVLLNGVEFFGGLSRRFMVSSMVKTGESVHIVGPLRLLQTPTVSSWKREDVNLTNMSFHIVTSTTPVVITYALSILRAVIAYICQKY